jgi:DMSO/TMAO reductase YedYZ heme-binding membrane subunit
LVKKIVFSIAIATVLALALVAWRLRQASNGLNVAPSAAQEIEKAKHR